jgi:pectin methylesterase-like acyl-CoA thioesterase
MNIKTIKSAWILCLLLIVSYQGYSKKSELSVWDTLPQSNKLYDAVIDINGSGDYRELQQAIDHAPANRTKPWRIFIKNGRYNGLVRIPENKPYIYLIGQDKQKVIISFMINCGNPDNPKDNGRQYAKANFQQAECAAVVVDASDFYAENITFENAYGVQFKSGPQALAIRINKDRTAFYNCKFRSFQDTWRTSTKAVNDRTYADSCWVEGAVDYFYGGGNAYIENTTFYNVRGGSVIVAPSQKAGTQWGYVFNHCIIDGNKASADGRTKLGRPWHDEPIAVFLNTIIKIPLAPEGWTDMGPAAKLFAEYNSRDAAGIPIDLSKRRTWYQQSKGEGGQRITGLQAVLTEKQAANYTYQHVIKGSDGWDPVAFFKKPAAVEGLKRAAGGLKWQKSAGATGYIVYKNGQVINFAKKTFLKLDAKTAGDYTVRGVTGNGTLGNVSNTLSIQ